MYDMVEYNHEITLDWQLLILLIGLVQIKCFSNYNNYYFTAINEMHEHMEKLVFCGVCASGQSEHLSKTKKVSWEKSFINAYK